MTAEEPATPVTPATPAPATPAAEKDRFCEVPWPTTKGGPRPAQSQDCIDPESECGDYPGVHHPLGYSGVSCVHADAANVCDASQVNVWMFCKANGTRHEWTCPTGTVKVGTCTVPATPDEGDSSADADGSQAEY
jgi:hypothetical protein